MRDASLVLVGLLGAFLSPTTLAYPGFAKDIPNGEAVKDKDGQDWPGVGHFARGGAGPRNQFGVDFKNQGLSWTKALCEMDSDGDGLTNGQELGDPECLWKKGDTPQFDKGITHPGQASADDVAREIETCTNFTVPPGATHTSGVVNLTFTPYQVPTKDTTYAKFAFNLYDALTSAGMSTTDGPYYGIRFGMINKNPHVVHHLILYGCSKEPSGDLLSQPSEVGSMPCNDMRYAWAVGGKDLCLPDNVGFAFPVASRETTWHVIEIHYDNPQGQTGIADESGVTIQLARKLSSAEVPDFVPSGYLWSGAGVSARAITIPPGKDVYHLQTECSYPSIGSEGITIFAYLNHGHLLARKMWTTLTRNDKYLHDVGCDGNYDFDLQQLRPFEKPITLYSNDKLYSNCVYDSTSRTEVTPGGDETTNEMCISFFLYYPEVPNIRRCLVTPKVKTGTTAGLHSCCDNSGGECVDGADGAAAAGGGGGMFGTSPSWLVWHVFLMVLGWMIVLPAGIAMAVFGKERFSQGAWFKYHRGLQVGGLCIASSGAIAAMANISGHMNSWHKALGVIVMVLGWLQPLNAYFRPHATAPGETKAPGRAKWELLHKGGGRVVMMLAMFNVYLGASVARSVYQQTKLAYFVYVMCVISVIVSVGMTVMRCRGGKSAVAQLSEKNAGIA